MQKEEPGQAAGQQNPVQESGQQNLVQEPVQNHPARKSGRTQPAPVSHRKNPVRKAAQRPSGRDKKAMTEKHRKPEGEDSLVNRMAQWKYSKEQTEELHRMTAAGMPKEVILSVFYPETDVETLREIRKTFQAAQDAEV